MIEVKAADIKFKAFGLVRDKNGKPKIDDYRNCPEEIKNMLSQTEREELENGTYTR